MIMVDIKRYLTKIWKSPLISSIFATKLYIPYTIQNNDVMIKTMQSCSEKLDLQSSTRQKTNKHLLDESLVSNHLKKMTSCSSLSSFSSNRPLSDPKAKADDSHSLGVYRHTSEHEYTLMKGDWLTSPLHSLRRPSLRMSQWWEGLGL